MKSFISNWRYKFCLYYSQLFLVKGYDWKESFWLSSYHHPSSFSFPFSWVCCWGLGCPQWCQSIKKAPQYNYMAEYGTKETMHAWYRKNKIHPLENAHMRIKRTQWDFLCQRLAWTFFSCMSGYLMCFGYSYAEKPARLLASTH